MSQYTHGTIDATTKTGTQLALDIASEESAQNTNHSGASRPSYAVAGMVWVKTVSATAHEHYYFDGTDDILLGTVNPTTNVWVPVNSGKSVATEEKVQLQSYVRFTAGGTADAITGTLDPAIASYTAGLRVTCTPPGANTVTNPTIALNGLAAKTIKKRDSGGSKVALAAGDYNASGPFDFEHDGTDFILLNPVPNGVTSSASVQTQAYTRFTAGGTADAITGTLDPTITVYTAGLRVTTTPLGANTVTNPTIALNGLAAKTIKKRDSSGSLVALVAGDYNASGAYDFEYNGTDFILLNEHIQIGVSANSVVKVDQTITSTATATTVTLGTTLEHLLTGTTTVTAFNGVAGVKYHCRADGAFILTHHATNLIITQTGADITTAAGDTFDVYMLTSTTCRIVNYTRASGSALVGGGSEDYILIREEQVSGTQGGTFTSGAWQTRVLNTEVHDAGGHASLSANVVTLAAGTYRFSAKAPAYAVNSHKVRLANTADSIYYYGLSAYTSQTVAVTTVSHVSGRFTIAASKTFELQHYCQTSETTDGFGTANSFGVIEVYSQIEFWKEN